MIKNSPVKPVPLPREGRGRPRSTAARNRVLRAARALLDAHGAGAVTIEAVSARSGVSKPTIYRTWPNAQAVIMAALMQSPAAAADAAPPAEGLRALRQQLRDVVGALASRTGRSVTMLLAASDPETELSKAFRHHFILARRNEGRRMLHEASARGEVRAGLDLELALDQLYGPIFFRILVGHAPLDEPFCERLLDQVIAGIGGPARRRRP